MADNEAKLSIKLDGNAEAGAKAAAEAMAGLQSQLKGTQGSIKQLNTLFKSLHGETEDVKAAKEGLAKQLEAEKAAMSKVSLEIIKQNAANKKALDNAKQLKDRKSELEDKAKKEQKNQDKINASISKAGGPVSTLKDKLGGLKEAMSTSEGRSALFASATLGAVAAVAALAVGLVAGAVAIGSFILKSADAARSVGLLREAAMNGNAQWGKNFGEQVDALARKVPTSKAEIDALGISLAKSRIGGQIWVDTLNAVTQASAALGSDAGNALKGFIERGKQFNRFQLNPLEMVGTGIDFKDVAEALSKSMHVGVKEATQALVEGRVKLADGAKALRDAVEKKVGGVNLRQMLSLENLSKKLGESFDELTKGIDLEPLLKGFKEIANMFSITTTSGQALKQIVEIFGKELFGSFAAGTPLAKKFIYGAIIGVQELIIGYLQLKNSLKKTFGDSEVLKNVDTLKLVLEAGKFAAYGVAAAMVLVAGAIAVAVAPFALLYAAFAGFTAAGESVGKWFRETDWSGLGTAIVDGLVNGLKLGANALKNAVLGLAEGTRDTFKNVLGIHSPSTVFAGYGRNIAEGTEQGIDAGKSGVNQSVSSMVDVPSGGGGKRGGASSVVVNVTINASGGDAKAVAAAVSTESILEQITKAVVDALHGGGGPVPA